MTSDLRVARANALPFCAGAGFGDDGGLACRAMGLWAVRLFVEPGAGSGLGAWEGAALVEASWASTPLLVALAAVLLGTSLVSSRVWKGWHR